MTVPSPVSPSAVEAWRRARARLRGVVEQQDTLAGRAFDLTTQVLILLSIVGFTMDTLPDLGPRTRLVLRMSEDLFGALFTMEYLLRLLVSSPTRRYATSFFGVVDVIAIAPYWLGFAVDLRSLRSLRFLRVFRALKLLRYTRAIARYRRALTLAREELLVFFLASILVFYLCGVGIYYFEREAQPENFRSVLDGLWWAVATLTTVGYGDIYPVTAGGRLFTYIVLMIGLGIVAVPAGLLSASLSEALREERETAAAEPAASRDTEPTPPAPQPPEEPDP